MSGFGEIARLNAQLQDKEAALAECVDEVLFFENKLKMEEKKSASAVEALTACSNSQKDSIAALMEYVLVLEDTVGGIPQSLFGQREELARTLGKTEEEVAKCSDTLQTLKVSISLGTTFNRLDTFLGRANSTKGGNSSVRIKRSGTVVVNSSSRSPGGYNISSFLSPSEERERFDSEVVTTPESSVKISRSGSVTIEKATESLSNRGQINGLRNRISALEGELADARVKIGVSERSRLGAIRDKDAMSKELEAVSQEKESLLLEVKTAKHEVETALDDARQAEMDRESFERRVDSLETQLRDGWAARDQAVSEAKHAERSMKEAHRKELEAMRTRDKAYSDLERVEKEKADLTNNVERLQRTLDETARKLEGVTLDLDDQKGKVARLTLERNTARAERDTAVVDAENSKQKTQAAELEKKYAMDDVAEAIRQRDAAQQQAVAAIEEEENATKQKQAALLNSLRAQESAEAAVRARKEAEKTARSSLQASEDLRLEVMNERRQKEAIMKEMKVALQERQNAVVELKMLNQEGDSSRSAVAESKAATADIIKAKECVEQELRIMQEKYAKCQVEIEENRKLSLKAEQTEQTLLAQIKMLHDATLPKVNHDAVEQATILKEQERLKMNLGDWKRQYDLLSKNSDLLQVQLNKVTREYDQLKASLNETKVSRENPLHGRSRERSPAPRPPSSVDDGFERARVHVRRSGSVVIMDHARPKAPIQTPTPAIDNSRVIHIDRDGKMSQIEPNGSAMHWESNQFNSPGAQTNLSSLQSQVRRMKEQAAFAANRAREDVAAVEVAATGMREKLRLVEEEKVREREKNATLMQKVSYLQDDLKNAKDKYARLEESYESEKNDCRTLREKLHKIESELSSYEHTTSNLRTDITRKDTELKMLRERKDVADEEIKRLRLDNQKHLDEKYQMLDDLRNAQSSMQSGHEVTEQTVSRFQAQVNELKVSLQQERDRAATLETDLSKCNEQLARAEEERSRLFTELEGAAAHLRLVGLQKAAVTRELEQVYTALSELEGQLSTSRTENKRLRLAHANFSSSATEGRHDPLHDSATTNPFEGNAESIPRSTIKISRRGSVELVRDSFKDPHPSMVPLPDLKGPSASTDSSTITGVASQSDIDLGTASTRRGTYYGMYGQSEANRLRQLNRTRSTFERAQYPTITPSSQQSERG